jgi:iron complex outermembrane recepter protein
MAVWGVTMKTYLALAALLLYQLSATTSLADENTRDLDTLVISAIRWETTGIPTAGSITVITHEQIIESGANRVMDILRGQGGVQIQDLYGDGSRTIVSIRGFGENAGANTLILVDGRRLNNTDLKSPDLGFISVKDIERIEIIQGSASVLFGDQAVGGVINIITRKTDTLELAVETGYGSYGHNFQIAKIANRFDNGIGIRASAERRQSENYRNHNDLEYDNLFANLGYEWNRGNAFVEYLHVHEDLETPGALFKENLALSRTGVRPLGTMDFNDSTSDAGRIGGTFLISPDWDFAAEYSHRNEDVNGCLVFCTTFEQHRLARAFNPRIRGNIPFAGYNLQLIIGADLENTEYKLISGVGDTINDQDMYAVYTLMTLPINHQFSLTGGVRYADFENNSFKRDPFISPFPLLTAKKNSDDQTAYTAGIVYTPTQEWRLYLKGETIFRFPLADELTGTVAPVDILKTQTGESYEAGIEWRNYRLHTKLTGFKLDLEDEIAFDPTAGFFGANVNFDPTERTGTIVEVNFIPVEQLEIGAQYTYTHAEFDDGPYSGKRIPFVAEHQFHLNASWRFWRNWNLFGEIFLISDRIAIGDVGDDFPHLPGYGIGNMNLRYDNDNLSLSAKVNNVLDKEYSNSAATGFNENIGFAVDTGFYPAPERNFMLTIGYQY